MKRSDQEWTPQEILVFCREKNVKAVDFRYTDLLGTQRRISAPVGRFDIDLFESGFAADGAGIALEADGAGDVLIVPQPERVYVDPFAEAPTLVVACNVQDPSTREDHASDPRSLALRAQNYLIASGAADAASFAAEVDFYLFENVRFDSQPAASFVFLDAPEQRSGVGRHGAHAAAVSEPLVDLRNEILLTALECGLEIERQRSVPTAGRQCGIDLRPDDLVGAADAAMTLKYVVKNVARKHGKTATFMPKPIYGEAGSGLRTHLSLSKDGQPLLAGSGYGGLSEAGLHAIGGILRHAPALLAFCAPSTNSYKRLAAGTADGPVRLGYSSRDRRAACRVPPGSQSPKTKRIEFRCPDPSANPYLAFSAILMAAIDGIQNKIHPGPPLDRDVLDDLNEDQGDPPLTPGSLADSLRALQTDHDFLLRGDVFTPELIESWIAAKIEGELDPVRLRPHPHEFAMYFDV
ncbi:MAG TPA: glutamine synthetase beta-grasp domain-containing protein [Pirellulaceae bacterium]|jgi:glutamine synthetase|nr:glutamine synthetase beta-grasp domain-containing protein [Pirellulaceae bacterium]